MQTILGSGGAIGIALAKILPEYTDKVRLVSRNPKNVTGNEELYSADLLNIREVEKAVEGSDIVYLTVGLPYKLKIWEEQWPIIMQNVIDACIKYKSKLVFFDNIYMYDPDHLSGMDEETPQNPVSKKGKVRKKIADLLLSKIGSGELTALIARSADFYGPSIGMNSVLTSTVFNNLSKGKKADWLGSVNYKHSFTYTPDAAKATAILANSEDSYNQVWHLPTAQNPFTGEEWISHIAEHLNAKPNYRAVPKMMVKILSLFIPIMKELYEMMYQYDRDYIFDSSKFETKFNIKPTSYLEGIKEIVKEDYNK